METLEKILSKCESTGAWYGEKITDVNQRNFMGDTVLHTICSWGDASAVRLLVNAGADVNAIGDQDATPLFNAIIGKNLDIVRILIESGVDATVRSKTLGTALDYAKNLKSDSKLIELIERSSKIKRPKQRGS